jgi:hypothetical protein
LFTVIEWRDPVVENLPGAFVTASDDALVFWTPVVGPTGMLMAHRFAAYAAQQPTNWTPEDLAATFGMGGSRARLEHTLCRLERFGIIRRDGGSIAVRVKLAPLTASQLQRLPDYLRHALP